MAGLNLRRTLFGGNDIAIDLGTANTLIYVKGVGVVVDEPTLLAVNKDDQSILTIGKEAKKLVGRVPDSIELIKPLRDGVISEIEMAEELVKTLLTKAIGRSYSSPRIVICVPNGVTSVVQRSIETAAHASGASEVFTIEEPMAAAIGSGLNIFEPYGNMIIDIGGGTTEIAVISMGDIVNANSVRVGGEDMTEVLIDWLRAEHQILVDPHTAVGIGAAKKLGLEKNCVVLSTAHPCKFPKAIEDAVFKVEKLPESLKYVYDRNEKFDVLPNNIEKVKEYVMNSI